MEDGDKRVPPPERINLCLSGGGLRATFFHLGVIRALRRLQLLHKVTNVISVSGGSIFAAHLIQHWDRYAGEPSDFDRVQDELLTLRNWDLRGVVIRRSLLWWPLYFLSLRFPRLLSRFRVGRTELLALEYEKFFKKSHLDDLRDSPQIHLVSTNLVTGSPCSFTNKHYIVHDQNKRLPYYAELTKLSKAVAASSAFPPVFPPIRFNESMTAGKVGGFHGATHILTDGGVYDNTGYISAVFLEEDMKEKGEQLSDFVVVSDAGSPFQFNFDSEYTNPIDYAARASEVVMSRVAEETLKRIVGEDRTALIPIDLIIDDVSLSPQNQKAVSQIRTDLDRFSDLEVAALVAHGEATTTAQLLQKIQAAPDDSQSNDFPFTLPKSPELAKALERSWQVKWWNSFSIFLIRVLS